MCTSIGESGIDTACWPDPGTSKRHAVGWRGGLLELNGEADHVHLPIAQLPNLDLSIFEQPHDHEFSLVAQGVRRQAEAVYRKPGSRS
jgi:hypothetical protein